MKKICVFCGSRPGAQPDYMEAARTTGRVLAERGLTLVYGGGKVGIMGTVAASVLENGGDVIGAIPRHMAERELAHPGLTALHVVETMHDRKALMAELADGFIALPGGLGTFEEVLEVLTWAQLALHHKPVGLLNVQGYYDHLLGFLDHTTAEAFMEPEHRQMLLVDTDPAGLLAQFERYQAPVVDKIRIALEETEKHAG